MQQYKNSTRFHIKRTASAHKAIDAPPANPTTTAAPTIKGKENPYAKPRASKCYRCGEPEHRFNECPKRRSSIWQTTRTKTKY